MIEKIIGYFLRIGVLISAFFFVFGIIFSILDLNISNLLLRIGLLVLISTPILRVMLGLAIFVLEKDKIYILITSLVIFNLLFALLFLPILI